jgi:GTPase Era involved in 16S rRNA processing
LASKVGVSTEPYEGWEGLVQGADNNSSTSLLFRLVRASFCVVVAGEYNAGKSTLINALLGQAVMKTGSLPTTDALHVLGYNHHPSDDATVNRRMEDDNDVHTNTSLVDGFGSVQIRQCRLPLLQDLTLVDTPGTNAVLTEHTALTVGILPAADMILFCTSADRPFSESERTLLASLTTQFRQPQSVVIVVNKMDILDDTGGLYGAAEKKRVLDYVTLHASRTLGTIPTVLAVSARDAWAALQTASSPTVARSSALWQRSNLSALHDYLHNTLSTRAKIQAKLASPVGLSLSLLEACRQQLAAEQEALQGDIATLQLLEQQCEAWRREYQSVLTAATADVQAILTLQSERASVLVTRQSMWNFFACAGNATKLQEEWHQTKPPLWSLISKSPSSQQQLGPITGTTPVQAVLLDLVRDTADTMATRSRSQGQALIEYLGPRSALASTNSGGPGRRPHHTSLVGNVTAAASFADLQGSISDALRGAVLRHVPETLESTSESSLLENLPRVAGLSLALSVASGVGAGVTATAFVPGLDVGLGAAMSVSLGLASTLVLMVGRQHLVRSYQTGWLDASRRLRDDVAAVGAWQVERLERRLSEGVAPYTRWVSSERERLTELSEQCGTLTQSAHRLQKRIANV